MASLLAMLTKLLRKYAPVVLSKHNGIATESLPVSSGYQDTPNMERVRSTLSPLRVVFPAVFDVQFPPAFGQGSSLARLHQPCY